MRLQWTSVVRALALHFCFVSLSNALTAEGSTIEEPETIDLLTDAKDMRQAMSGWGTNENTLINILTHRTYNNRLKITQLYRETYSKSLWEDIKSETSNHFRTTLKGLVLPEARFLAEEMRNAMSGWGTNEDTLLLCLMLTVNDYDTVQGLKDYYKAIYNTDLEDEIKGETDSPFKDFLVEVLDRPKFNESAEVDNEAVEADFSDIKEFLAAKEVKDIVYLVTSRSLKHLAILQEKYYQSEGSELYQALESITDHHMKDGFVSLMSVATDFTRYCAYELHNAMDGDGTEEGVLTRIITTRADKDLADIKEMYFEMFNKKLSQQIKDDTSGDYRKTLLSLVN
ncbi:annexin A13-like [Bolinopsis microptera]|uniref:annexin A13-like n=1 Tax=Bolinopsis microptera TaxID=2820187 RepID=UPI003078E057